MMRSLRYCVLAAAVACGGGGANKHGGGETAESTAHDPSTGVGTETDESTAELAEHNRHHQHGDGAMAMAISIGSLDAPPGQPAKIKQVTAGPHAHRAPALAAE